MIGSFRFFTYFFVIFQICLHLPAPHADAAFYKMASMLPEESPATRKARELNNLIRRETNGEVTIRYLGGAIAGDDFQVIDKMEAGQIDIGVISTFGLRRILPRTFLLEMPGVCLNNDEYLYVRQALIEEIERDFERKGFILTGLGKVGTGYQFLTKGVDPPPSIATVDDYIRIGSQSLTWSYPGDLLMQRTLEKHSWKKIVPLDIWNVKTALGNNTINRFLNTPAITIGFQWHVNVRYIIDVPITSVNFGVVARRDFHNKLPEKTRQYVKTNTQKWLDTEVAGMLLKMEADAMNMFNEIGIQILSPEEEVRKHISESYHDSIDAAIELGMVTRDDVNRVISLVAEYRAAHPITPLLLEDVIVISHPQVSETELSSNEFKELFIGNRKVWSNGQDVVIAIPSRPEAQREFLRRVVKKTSQQYANTWKKKVFEGSGKMPSTFSRQQDIVEFVRNTPGSIGFVSSGTDISGVKRLPLTE